MNETIIAWFGDSWVKGYGIDRHIVRKVSFPSLISSELNLDFVNFARAGSSIGHLVYGIDRIVKLREKTKRPVFAFFGLTYPWRVCIETSNNKKQTVGVHSFDISGYKEWGEKILTDYYVIKESCIVLSWISEQCQKNNIPFKFFNILTNFKDFELSSFSKYLDKDNWLIDPMWSTYSSLYGINDFDFSKIGILEKTKQGKEVKNRYFLPCQHPNELGHKVIASEMIESCRDAIKI